MREKNIFFTIFRKFNLFLKLLFKAKFTFSEPKHSDIIIFDAKSSKGIAEILKNFSEL